MTDGKLVYAVAAAGANLLGAFAVTWRSRWSTRALDAMLAFAAGFMISVSLLDLFPEALTRGGRGAAIVALGAYLAVHVTQHVIGTHFHFGEETHHVSEAVSVAALVGLLLHTFVDGVAVASGLERPVHRLPTRVLSQGQKRRVALARLWLSARPLWLLDEPFASLDATATGYLTQQVQSHLNRGGMVVVATHQEIALPSDCIQHLRLTR